MPQELSTGRATERSTFKTLYSPTDSPSSKSCFCGWLGLLINPAPRTCTLPKLMLSALAVSPRTSTPTMPSLLPLMPVKDLQWGNT